MANSNIYCLTVLGAGVLGGQIAWHSAFKGKTVVVYDLFPDALEMAMTTHESYARIYKDQFGASDADIAATRTRLTFSDKLNDSVGKADLVIEAVPEVPEIKTKTYQEMAKRLQPHTIIATNSSTLLCRDFAEATGRPEKFCALHFANMIWALNLAEIMAHPKTARDTLTAITHFAIEIGMVPIAVQKEQNGYILNSWFVPLLTAGLALVVDGVSTPEDVDRSFMICNPGVAMGPCGMADMVGMNTAYAVAFHWGTLNNDTQKLRIAAYIKERFLDKGLLGMLGGEGFYKYPDPAYSAPDFLAVPEASAVPDIVTLAILK